MSKIKINLDRPRISSNKISNKMNFEEILGFQKVMAKPFYKNAWFYGVSGIASVGLVAGGVYTLIPNSDVLLQQEIITENVMISQVLLPDVGLGSETDVEREKNNQIKKETPIAEKSTFKKITNQKPQIIEEIIYEEEIIEKEKYQEVSDEAVEIFSYMDLFPRISGRINGGITKEELLSEEGLVTNSEVKIISFQLHLVDGTGGHVFESEGNTLNKEMRSAIGLINVGEEIYFEKIDGESKTGEIVRLSPLRYVLLN